MHAKQISESEIGPRIAPFVIEGAFAGRDQRTAAYNETTYGRTLLVGEAANVGKDQHRQARRLAVDIAGMYREVGDASPDQRLREAFVRSIHQFGRVIAAIKIGIPLRPDQSYAGHRLAMDEVCFIRLVPFHY